MVRWVYSNDVILFEIEMFVKCRTTRESVRLSRCRAGPRGARCGPDRSLQSANWRRTGPHTARHNAHKPTRGSDKQTQPPTTFNSIYIARSAVQNSLKPSTALQRKLRNPQTKSRGTMICCSVGIKVILLSDRSVLVTFISLKNLEPVMVMQGFTLVPVNCNFIS